MFPSADQLLPFTTHNSVEEVHNQTIFYSNLGQNYRIVHDVMCWLTARLVVVSMVLTCIHRVYYTQKSQLSWVTTRASK